MEMFPSFAATKFLPISQMSSFASWSLRYVLLTAMAVSPFPIHIHSLLYIQNKFVSAFSISFLVSPKFDHFRGNIKKNRLMRDQTVIGGMILFVYFTRGYPKPDA